VTPRQPVRLVELTHEERGLLRRLIRDHASKLGYGLKYHDFDTCPGGPREWPEPLRRADTLIRKLHDHRYVGGLAWPEPSSSRVSTATVQPARK
jgi:hypothetical protein